MTKSNSVQVTNLIPGAEKIGRGINIFNGYYTADEVPGQLLNLAQNAQFEPQTVLGQTYMVPTQMSFSLDTSGDVVSDSFESRSAVATHFQDKAGVSGSYGAFSGSINAEFDNSSNMVEEQFYAIVEGNVSLYSLEQTNLSLQNVDDAAKTNAVYTNLIDFLNSGTVFSDDNRDKFFNFFEHFGTHVIEKIQMGGFLNYFCSINKSQYTTSSNAKVDIEAEYNAAFRVKGNNSAAWNNVSDKWYNNSKKHLICHGGDSTKANGLLGVHTKNDNLFDAFNAWSDSVKEAPARIGCRLTPVVDLWKGSNSYPNMKAAYEDYANARLFTTLAVTGSVITWKSKNYQIEPVHITDNEINTYMYNHWIVINRTTGELKLIPGAFDITVDNDKYQMHHIHFDVPPEIKTLTNSIVIFILMEGHYAPGQLPIESDLLATLRELGAGNVLDNYNNDSGHYGYNGYVLLGATASGPNTGIEKTNVHSGGKPVDLNLDVSMYIQNGKYAFPLT